jgi:uncharacterized phage protein (TIGR02220 family)
MKDSIYFQHDSNAHNDEKIIKLRMKYGWQGYGVFWALIEIMRESTDVVLSLSECNAFAFRLHCELNLIEFVNDCIDWGLFKKEGNLFYSPRLHKNVSHMKNKSKQASDAAFLRWNKENDANALQTQSDSTATVLPTQSDSMHRTGQDSKEQERKEQILSVVLHLNETCKTDYRPKTKATHSAINARLNDGFSVEDLKLVVEQKNKDWGADLKMASYLRPTTLFGAEKFEGYLQEAKKKQQSKKPTLTHERDDSW